MATTAQDQIMRDIEAVEGFMDSSTKDYNKRLKYAGLYSANATTKMRLMEERDNFNAICLQERDALHYGHVSLG